MDRLFWSLADEMDVNGFDELFGWIPFVFLLSVLLLITVLVTIWLKHHKEKKTWKIPTLVLSGILLLMVIEIPLKIIYKNCNTVSRDPELLGMLKNDDETSEFILNRDYYALPCPLQNFIDNGWDRINKDRSLVDIHEMLDEHPEVLFFQIATPYGKLILVVEYGGESGYEPGEGMVTAAVYTSHKDQTELYASPNKDYFVTKNGMTENTSFHAASEIMDGKLDGHPMKIEKRKGDDPFSDITYGNTVTFRPEAYKDAEERSRKSEAWKKYGVGCASYNLYQSSASETRDSLSIQTVRWIVWAFVFGATGIIILAVNLIRKRRSKQK